TRLSPRYALSRTPDQEFLPLVGKGITRRLPFGPDFGHASASARSDGISFARLGEHFLAHFPKHLSCARRAAFRRRPSMRAEGQAHIDRIEAALALVRRSLDWDRAVRRLDELNARVEDPTLWNDPKDAEEVMRERRRLESAIGTVNEIGREMADAIEFVELGEMEDDEDVVAERAAADQVQALMGGEADANDTYLEIHAGAGGTESQDWAEMLLRMYARWAERRGFKVETVEYQAGEQAGIKSATLQIKGENA